MNLNFTEIQTIINIKKQGEKVNVSDALFYLLVDNDIIINPKENRTIKDLKTSQFSLKPRGNFTMMIQIFYRLYKGIKKKFPNAKIRYFDECKVKTARIKLSDKIKVGLPNYIYRDDEHYVVLPGWKKQNFIGIKEPSPNDDVLEVDGVLIDKAILKDDYIMVPLFNILKMEKDNLGLHIGKKLNGTNDLSLLTEEELTRLQDFSNMMGVIKYRLLN